MSKPKDIYFSVDIETNGPIVGVHSMLSFAAVAFTIHDNNIIILDFFSRNLKEIDNGIQDADTMNNFWSKFPEAYSKCRENQSDIKISMNEFSDWVKNIAGINIPVFVAYPACFDFSWINYYLLRFVGTNVFGFSALDMKSYALGKLNFNHFNNVNKSTMPQEWLPVDMPHTHVALDDALEQAYLFKGMKLHKSN